jgi:hypothetical protein
MIGHHAVRSKFNLEGYCELQNFIDCKSREILLEECAASRRCASRKANSMWADVIEVRKTWWTGHDGRLNVQATIRPAGLKPTPST